LSILHIVLLLRQACRNSEILAHISVFSSLLAMRLSKERVLHISESLATRLRDEGLVAIVGNHKAFVEQIDRAIIEELSVEDRLNAEVRQLLNAYEQDIERGHVDYQKMFTMVKSKLARERGIIL
jgi:hypothetical protein